MDKRAEANIIIIGILLIVGLIALSTFVDLGALNRGGRVIIETTQEESYFDKSVKSIEYPIKMTFYPGTGWDKMCYSGLLGYYVQEDKIGGDIIKGGKLAYSEIDHRADKKNVPAIYDWIITINTNGLDGKYKLVMKNYMSPLDDTPYTGSCKSEEIWRQKQIAVYDKIDFDEQPKNWLDTFGLNSDVHLEGQKTFKFYLGTGGVTQEYGDTIVTKPIVQCNWWCRFLNWINSLF